MLIVQQRPRLLGVQARGGPRITSRRYEDRRLELMASGAEGSTLDLGYAALPNPYLTGVPTVGVDIFIPATPTGYREELAGDVMSLRDVVGSRTFDTVIAGEIIEHLRDPYGFLEGLHSVMTRTSKLIISTPNPLGSPVVLFEYFQSKRFFYAHDHLYYFTPRWVRRMLERSGFNVQTVKGVGLWSPIGPVVPCPASVSYQVIYTAGVH